MDISGYTCKGTLHLHVQTEGTTILGVIMAIVILSQEKITVSCSDQIGFI